MWTHTLAVHTGDTATVVDLTRQVNEPISELGDGLLHVLLPHATAGLALMEVGSGSDEDLLHRLDELLPTSETYTHRYGSRGHGRDHLLPALISPALTLPVVGGRLHLGAWQSLVMVDTNVDNPVRQVHLSFLAG